MNPPAQLQKWFMPSIFDLIVATVFCTMILADPLIGCFDIFWHLRTGDLLLSGVFPTTDIFSYTAYGKPWILHEWGSQVIFALIYNAFGFSGLIVLKSFVYALMYGLMFNLLLRKDTNIFISLGFTLLLVLGTAGAWTVRPHMFTNLFLVILFRIFVEFNDRGNPRILRWLPLLFLIWINLHGGYIIGFIFLAACTGAKLVTGFLKTTPDPKIFLSQAKALIAWGLISFAACFINPATWKGVMYPLMYIGGQMDSRMIQEWAAPAIHTDVHFFIYTALVILGIMFLRKIQPLHEIFLLTTFIFLAFSAIRHMAVFAIVATPMLAALWQEHLTRFFHLLKAAYVNHRMHHWLQILSDYLTSRSLWFNTMEQHLRCHVLAVTVIAIMAGLSVTFPDKLNIGLDRTRYPVEIAEHIRSNPVQGNIFNQYGWGGFLLWALPDHKVFIDGRMDVYKKEISVPYKTFINLEQGWEDIAEEYDIQHILAGKDQPISRFIIQVSPSWEIEKETDNAFFFTRKKVDK